jgi:ADP-heptose:LPS heptosyltransferase
MHVITTTEPLKRGAYNLAPGSYLADNVNAGELMMRNPSTISAQLAPNPRPIEDMLTLARATNHGSNYAPRILVIRVGGFGDLLFLTPIFRHIKTLIPGSHIAVSCYAGFAEILAHNPDIAEIIPYPIPLATIETFDAVVPLENTVENEHDEHAVDRYFREFGFDPATIPAESKRCIYHMTDSERTGALSAFPTRLDDKGTAIPRLGVQAVASAMCRTYPHDQLAETCQALHARGWEIFFFGEPRTLQIAERDRVTNLTLRGLTFRQSAAVLATCDVVLAPDSALTHIAGALDLPCVALYGPFPWKLRTAYHPKTIALAGKGPCAPCFHHVSGRQHFPSDGPCAKSGRCEVLASIDSNRVASKISALYKASLHIAAQRAEGKM